MRQKRIGREVSCLKNLFSRNIENNDTLDYDYPSVLELAKMLSELNYNAGRYINLVLENQGENTKEIVANKILTAINTSVEIYDCLFNN